MKRRPAPADKLSRSYDPKPIEDKWYAEWVDDGIFHADPTDDRPKFSIVIPPPNVTGSLHLGHALDNTLQDILCRSRRMRGFNVLWMPGTDHAGIATQNVVERALLADGKTRRELGREKFVERVWQWKEEYGSRIIGQLKKLGASCDWERERFTMDEGLSRAVKKVFVELYKKGLIYRGKYLINWCPRCQTALSDLEVAHRDEDGHLYSVRYKFTDSDEYMTVMTTRPETILGDTAIAVHPRDENNRRFVGRSVIAPITGRIIPIIEDNMVDPEFGTGAVKITPAHDPNDFLVGQRHGLEQIQVIDERGIMKDNAGKYAGMDRFDARLAIADDLRSSGDLLEVVDHKHSVGHCDRCGTIVEPNLSEQWFVRTKELAAAGIKAVKAGEIKFIPEQWTATYHQWMENVRDWCISRQLWWGHQIPAWYCEDCGEVIVAEGEPTACTCGSKKLRRDEDVLDTWFSSALWPFSTMGWPDRTPELEAYYPTTVLVTGFDIIFFWVSRMIMMGLEFMKEPPFRDVYIHALVRDEHGQKMSKSKGNGIDPLEVIEKHGADALRLTLASLTLQGRDIYLSESRIETFRFFMNKIWNAARFALMNLENADHDLELNGSEPLRTHDRWILARVDQVAEEITKLLDGYFFGEAARALYDFVWGELCDWYLEMTKPALRGDEGEPRRRTAQSVLYNVFRDVLKLLHPFIPFTTEELWDAFGYSNRIIGRSEWPCGGKIPDTGRDIAAMDTIREVVRAMRNLRAEIKMPPQKAAPEMCLKIKQGTLRAMLLENDDIIRLLTKTDKISLLDVNDPRPHKCITAVTNDWELYFPIGDLLDIEAEIKRLESESSKLASEIEKIDKKLSNKNFIERAPEEVVKKEQEARVSAQERMTRIADNINSLR